MDIDTVDGSDANQRQTARPAPRPGKKRPRPEPGSWVLRLAMDRPAVDRSGADHGTRVGDTPTRANAVAPPITVMYHAPAPGEIAVTVSLLPARIERWS